MGQRRGHLIRSVPGCPRPNKATQPTADRLHSYVTPYNHGETARDGPELGGMLQPPPLGWVVLDRACAAHDALVIVVKPSPAPINRR